MTMLGDHIAAVRRVERQAIFVYVSSIVGIFSSMAALHSLPSWLAKYAVEFFSALFMVAQIIAVGASLYRTFQEDGSE